MRQAVNSVARLLLRRLRQVELTRFGSTSAVLYQNLKMYKDLRHFLNTFEDANVTIHSSYHVLNKLIVCICSRAYNPNKSRTYRFVIA